jgi:hypothetical protein
MSPVVERDIMHIGRVMRATVVQCAPEMMLVEYWRNRLNERLETPCLTEHQRNTLLEFVHELNEIERQTNRKNARRISRREAYEAVESL